MAKTVAEMYKEHIDELPAAKDDRTFIFKTLLPRCSHCGAHTVPIDEEYPFSIRICPRCIMNELNASPEEDDYYADENSTEYDDLERNYETTCAELDNTRKRLNELLTEVSDLEIELRTQKDLTVTVQETCDELQGEINDFDDNMQAMRNEISRLRLEVEKWKKVANKKIKVSS